MTLRMLRMAADVEQRTEQHEARLLLLLAAAGKHTNRPVRGITKLAKLDFFLRYPNCLERALVVRERNPSDAKVLPFERTNIEAKMIRFRYGPWDHRYRSWLGVLAARGLVQLRLEGRTVLVGLTDRGLSMSAALGEASGFADLSARSRLIATVFGDWSGTKLKDFVYDAFPELSTMAWGEEIEL